MFQVGLNEAANIIINILLYGQDGNVLGYLYLEMQDESSYSFFINPPGVNTKLC